HRHWFAGVAQGAFGGAHHHFGVDELQARARRAALRGAEAVAAVDARRAGERLAYHLVTRIVDGGRTPGIGVTRTQHRDDWRAHGSGDVHHAAIVGHHQPAAPNECAQRLWTRRGRRDAGVWAEPRDDVAGQRLFVLGDATQDDRSQTMSLAE